MPIPFILGAAALAAAGYGVKKGLDAKEDYELAEDNNKRAASIVDDTKKDIERQRKYTQKGIEKLGNKKIKILSGSIKEFVEAYSERSEALAERLWNRNTIKIVVFLEFLCCEVGKHQSDDVADDGCEIAPCKALAHYKVGNSTNKCKVPIVPEVDVDSTCGLSQQH